MAVDKFDLLGPALAKVGEEAVRIIGGLPDGIYLYVEIGDGWVGPSLFKDEGNVVRYIDSAETDLSRLLIDAWCIEPEDKRWTGMEYMIDNAKFDAKFQFDDLTTYGGSFNRREQFLRARYGNKPVVYPPMPPGAFELKPSS